MRRRAIMLLEVIVALALLASLGAVVVRVQIAATRQTHAADQLAEAVELTERLLWQWSDTRIPVTLPSTGRFNEQLHWRREVRPTRVAVDVLATQVTVIVHATEPNSTPIEVYRVTWLVPEGQR